MSKVKSVRKNEHRNLCSQDFWARFSGTVYLELVFPENDNALIRFSNFTKLPNDLKEEDETKLDTLLNERNQSAAALRTQLLLIRCKLLARYLSPARLPSSSAAHRSSGHPAEAREAPRAPSQGLAPLPATAARPVKEEPQRFEYRLSVEDDDDWTGSRKPSPGGAESSGDSAADSSMEYPRSGMKPEREMHDPYACLFSDDEVEL